MNEFMRKGVFVTKRKIRNTMSNTLKDMWMKKTSYLCLLPYAFIFTLFTIVPIIISIYYSFTYYDILQAPRFVGFQNYVNLVTLDEVFLTTVYNTLLFSVIIGPGGFLISLIVAWMLNSLSSKLRAVFVVVFYAPSISGSAYLIWRVIFSGDSLGWLNHMLLQIGIVSSPIQWLTDERYMKAVVIIAALWMSLGTGFLSLVAGFQGIGKEYYEAGAIDGVKNRWQELWFITLPLLKNQLMFAAVMSITGSFAISDPIMQLIGYPNAGDAVTTIVMYMNDYATTRFDLGYASSIAVVLFIVMIGANKLVQSLLARVGK